MSFHEPPSILNSDGKLVAKVHHESQLHNKYSTTQRSSSLKMTFDEFKQKYKILDLPDRKDFMKAWLRDNEDIPSNLEPGINIVPLYNSTYIIYGNKKRKPVGILSIHKNGVEHIVVDDKYSGKGIATQLLIEARKLGATDIIPPISTEFSRLAYRFVIGEI